MGCEVGDGRHPDAQLHLARLRALREVRLPVASEAEAAVIRADKEAMQCVLAECGFEMEGDPADVMHGAHWSGFTVTAKRYAMGWCVTIHGNQGGARQMLAQSLPTLIHEATSTLACADALTPVRGYLIDFGSGPR